MALRVLCGNGFSSLAAWRMIELLCTQVDTPPFEPNRPFGLRPELRPYKRPVRGATKFDGVPPWRRAKTIAVPHGGQCVTAKEESPIMALTTSCHARMGSAGGRATGGRSPSGGQRTAGVDPSGPHGCGRPG